MRSDVPEVKLMRLSMIVAIVSFAVNVLLVGAAFYKHSGIRHSFNPQKFTEFGLIECANFVLTTVVMIILACWPWLAAMKDATAPARRNSVIAFSLASTASVLFFFVPSPVSPAEALGYYVLGHLLVVWVSYPLFRATFKPR